jgi:transposase
MNWYKRSGRPWPSAALLSIAPSHITARTDACLIAELGDPSRFRSAAALASYVGVVPRLRQSGKRAFSGARGLPFGNARLRHRLWMPTLVAVRKNPWLRAHYDRLLAAGKRPKVVIVSCMRKLLTAVYSVARNRRPFVSHVLGNGSLLIATTDSDLT